MSIWRAAVRLADEPPRNRGDNQGGLFMQRYLLSIYQPDGPVPPPEVLGRVMRDVHAFNEELKAAGAWVFAAGLHPPGTATVVHLQAGDLLITDGPFVEGKEHLGGFTVIEAPDLDAALGWGRKLARALSLDGVSSLPVEVRPFQH
jgi:hypothetical protein